GYGTDGQIWGCEILVCDLRDFERAGHLRYFPLSGGDAAARETWRPALGLLHEMGRDWQELGLGENVDPQALEWVARQLRGGKGRIVRTSSLGRLFDAAAFLLGICGRNRYEAEAAMTLESLAGGDCEAEDYEWGLEKEVGGVFCLDGRPLMDQLLCDRIAGRPVAQVARAFHGGVAAMLAEGAKRTALANGVGTVALSGGCFANRVLSRLVAAKVHEAGLRVLTHRRAPMGDGGVALGQAVVAAARLGIISKEER
ncbi:carbamoyltransferase HypF, partial [bacterium]|nr:carbamoyltransferase HypF [bacterium]